MTSLVVVDWALDAIPALGRSAWRAVRWVARLLGLLLSWALALRLVTLLGLVAAVFAWLFDSTAVLSLALAVVVLLVGVATWDHLAPVSCERFAAGPLRRYGWRRAARKSWPQLARDCGLSGRKSIRRRALGWDRDTRGGLIASISDTDQTWTDPTLRRVRTSGDELRLWIKTRSGQTLDALADGAPGIATTLGAVSHRVQADSPNVLRVTLTMRDALTSISTTPAHRDATAAVRAWDGAELGRCEDGTPWLLPLRGRHTLVTGCSGAGKGSVMWGIAAALAPGVPSGAVQLWGVDLKRGVELTIGRGLWHTLATTPAHALAVLAELLRVIDARGDAMAGHTRLHTPAAGDPLHVLVIDELAALIAYADPDTRREASRLLAEILTQGRALGVVVVACVQDPRKETVGMRGLFTQTIALRLRNADETRMVLGDGMAALAPAHAISPAAPGVGYLVTDDGHTLRVRAHWWDDQAIRATANGYPAPTRWDPADHAPTTEAPSRADGRVDTLELPIVPATPLDTSAPSPRPRKRSPRKPRTHSTGTTSEALT